MYLLTVRSPAVLQLSSTLLFSGLFRSSLFQRFFHSPQLSSADSFALRSFSGSSTLLNSPQRTPSLFALSAVVQLSSAEFPLSNLLNGSLFFPALPLHQQMFYFKSFAAKRDCLCHVLMESGVQPCIGLTHIHYNGPGCALSVLGTSPYPYTSRHRERHEVGYNTTQHTHTRGTHLNHRGVLAPSPYG